MEECEKKHIVENLSKLVDVTGWNVTTIAVLQGSGTFGLDDISFLKSIPDERQKIWEFYQKIITKSNSYQHLIAALEIGCQTGAVVILNALDRNKYTLEVEQRANSCSSSGTDKHVQTVKQPVAGTSESQKKAAVRFEVIKPVKLFTGREKQLEDLHKKLQQGTTKLAVISQMATIAGLGGIGKTELARRYIQKYGKEYDNNVIWISAQTEQTLTESFRKLATDYLKITLLNVDGKERCMTTVISEVYKYFEGKQCLFVFDNAESNDDIHKFLPLQVADPPYILITSRDTEWSFSLETLELNEMEESEAIAFVKGGLQILDESQDDVIVQLVKQLQCFPLALSQAISYIKQKQKLRKYTICQYLKEYETHSEKLLSSKHSPAEFNSYAETTFTTWKMTTESIAANEDCGKEAMCMLNMVSYFQPDKIPTKILLASNMNGSTDVDLQMEQNEHALRLLVKYSMVNIQPKKETISIHRLVQEVIRVELRREEQEEKTWRCALELLSARLDLNCLIHFCSVYKHCSSNKPLAIEFKTSTVEIMNIVFENTYKYTSALRIVTELKDVLKQHVSSNDYHLILLEIGLATLNKEMGNYENAVEGLERILAILTEDKIDMISEGELFAIQINLAKALDELGNPTAGLTMLVQIFKTVKSLNGMNHFNTIHALASIATYLQNLGHLENPFIGYENVKDLVENFGPKPLEIVAHLNTAYENTKHMITTDSKYALTFYKVALFFYLREDYETANNIAGEVYEQGKNSNDKVVQTQSIKCLSLRGSIKNKEGKHEEALKIFESVHTSYSHIAGSSDINTLVSKHNILQELIELGEIDTAFEEYSDVLEALKNGYPNHSFRFQVEQEIATTLFKMERFEESLALLIDLRTRIQSRFGETHPMLTNLDLCISKIKLFLMEVNR
ncbi:unnamed protein product [Orchesella dallaii]|uniref:NB-ARC domain-containing protein n=1 Tax=Orchesella dallaii TaxID=48710 RepID=A0ABP1PUB1_9HEXA